MRVELRQELSIAHAPALKGELLAALRDEEVWLDGTQVIAVDLTGLQLITAAHKSAVAEGKRFGFEPGKRSELIDRVARSSGFDGDIWRE